MSAPKDGGPAFPSGLYAYDGTGDPKPDGMSLRDWFAGMAMQGAIAYVNEHEDHYDQSLANTAIASYKIADAMLAAREGKEGA
jgi:hypothetical protein